MTIEQAEQMSQNATINASRKSFEVTAHAGTKGVDTAVQASVNSLKAINAAMTSHRRGRRSGKDGETKQGKVSLKEFTSDVQGRREIVGIEDRKLVKVIEQELKRHGVEFAVERRGDTRYFHVSGDDAGVVAHALERAQERVDAVLTRQKSKLDVRAQIDSALDRGQEDGDGELNQVQKQDRYPEEPRFSQWYAQNDSDMSRSITKDAALAQIASVPGDTEYKPGIRGGMDDVKGFVGQDRDVDRAIAKKFPQLMNDKQMAKAWSSPTPAPTPELNINQGPKR